MFPTKRFHSLIGGKTPQEYQLKGETTVYISGLNEYAIYSRKGTLLNMGCAGLMNIKLVFPVNEYIII
jgi:hypothetical protein